MKILVVEDNLDLNKAVVKGLTDAGFTVDSAVTGTEAWQSISINEYDLVVLDINLPGASGLEVLEKVRKDDELSDLPILALTARDSLDDKLTGLNNGFDDYLTKPFEFLELVARIRALLRRSKPNSDITLSYQNIVLDPTSRVCQVSGKDITLTKLEFNLLEYLLRHQGLVVQTTELIEHLWGEEADLLNPPVRTHIKNLRRKLGDDDLSLIQTIPGVGYKM